MNNASGKGSTYAVVSQAWIPIGRDNDMDTIWPNAISFLSRTETCSSTNLYAIHKAHVIFQKERAKITISEDLMCNNGYICLGFLGDILGEKRG